MTDSAAARADDSELKMGERQTRPMALPGMTVDQVRGPAEEGSLEEAVRMQVEALQSLGYIESHHAAQVQLAVVAARDIDHSTGRGAPSGRANLLRVMNEILEGLPQPVAASADKLQEVLMILKADHNDDEPLQLEQGAVNG